jgi:hypothetical protein
MRGYLGFVSAAICAASRRPDRRRAVIQFSEILRGSTLLPPNKRISAKSPAHRRFWPRSTTFGTAICFESGREIGKRETSPFIRFSILLYHAFLKPFCFGTASCIMCGMITSVTDHVCHAAQRSSCSGCAGSHSGNNFAAMATPRDTMLSIVATHNLSIVISRPIPRYG